MTDSFSIRKARAQFATLIHRTEAGDATVITRNGVPVAALVPIHEHQALEDAADELLAREAEAHRGDDTVGMSELLADLFAERNGGGTAAA
ncbi:type II toxin-antitoxin system Phd/YefM family antitoxin [Streptomyces sp. XM4011]|uniref:type II toxin-antitoxin system Phd/YefM family antitoxin n=1 Tax=Streptomyces sp. XM4011 TaxID=2929780 RepID=UPI001FF879F0|nr:type II toxin-antitoxin system Phd/YefM family antitoxin [Streptomyces sp. XM4011]MCK1815308.1 type II toxin-antitoxin system Phd/YefM family antitoxin [Streptomyces sp. XM4011]